MQYHIFYKSPKKEICRTYFLQHSFLLICTYVRETKQMERKQRVLILGAGGRDFHDFNSFWLWQSHIEVCGFCVGQIPGIEKRVYPVELILKTYGDSSPCPYTSDLPIFSQRDLARKVEHCNNTRTHKTKLCLQHHVL